jgi:hypothetical protein
LTLAHYHSTLLGRDVSTDSAKRLVYVWAWTRHGVWDAVAIYVVGEYFQLCSVVTQLSEGHPTTHLALLEYFLARREKDPYLVTVSVNSSIFPHPRWVREYHGVRCVSALVKL